MRARVAAAVVLAAASCSGDDGPNRLTPIDAEPPDPYRVVLEVPVTVNRNVDMLFVVDDSSSMADKQNNLAANFSSFIAPLAGEPGGFPDVHIGVVTTDMGTSASDGSTASPIGIVGQGGCAGRGEAGNLTSGASVSVSGAFVSDIANSDGTRARNYVGTLEEVLSNMSRVGTGGCGFEQPLAAMKAALGPNPANAGFLRPGAGLAIVFVTDEDDCSAKTLTLFGATAVSLGPQASFRCTRFGVSCTNGGNTPDEMNNAGVKTGCGANPSSEYVGEIGPYVEFVKSLKTDDKSLFVATIAGDRSPVETILETPVEGGAPVATLKHSCSYQGALREEMADPAVRLEAFTSAFGSRGLSSSICQTNLGPDLAAVGARIANMAGSACIATPLGSPPDCIAEDVVGTAVTPLSACDASGTPPCWRLVDDVSCQTGDRLSLRVERIEAPPPSTVVRLRCRVP